MFSLPEYVPLVDLVHRWHDERYEADLERVQTYSVAQVLGGHRSERDVFASIAPPDLAEHELFAALADQLFITSPAGTAMRLGRNAIVSSIDEASTANEIAEEAERENLKLEMLKTFLFDDSMQLFDPFMVNTIYDRVEQLRRSGTQASPWELADQIGQGRRHRLVPMLHERVGYTISLKGYDFCKLSSWRRLDVRLDAVASLLRPFDGWALCTPIEVLAPEAWALLIGHDTGIPAELAAGPGRKRLREKAAKAYHECYPKGHGRTPWREVAARVSAKMGQTVGARTIQRGLQEEQERQEPAD